MKKIFVAVVVSVLFVAQSAFAMTFQQPVEIGSIFIEPSPGIAIRGASYNSGKPVEKVRNETKYRGGVARWGNETDGLYCHYEKYPFHFGGKDKNFPINIMVHTSIYRINNDGDISLYLLNNTGNDARGTFYVLLGRRQDGTWVQYFNTRDLKTEYFGKDMYVYANYDGARCQGDTIIIEFKNVRGNNVIGEFRFKWDEAAQWFGVEQIIY